MKARRTRLGLMGAALGIVSAALAADMVMSPGRWEITAQIDFGGREVPRGMPFTEPMTSIACVTAEDVKKLRGPIPLPEGCRMSDQKVTGNEMSFVAHCEGAMVSYKMTFQSPDSFSGVSVSHGSDPSETLTMKITGKRTGPACSAKEQAEYSAE